MFVAIANIRFIKIPLKYALGSRFTETWFPLPLVDFTHNHRSYFITSKSTFFQHSIYENLKSKIPWIYEYRCRWTAYPKYLHCCCLFCLAILSAWIWFVLSIHPYYSRLPGYSSATEKTLKDGGEIELCKTTIKCKSCAYVLGCTPG